MGALITGTSLVKSPSGKNGVVIQLSPLWQQDDKGGKRSFGFVRAVIAAANKAGYLNVNSTIVKHLRVEQVVGKNAFIAYVNKKATTWTIG